MLTRPTLQLEEADEHRLLRQTIAGIAAGIGHAYFARTARAEEPPTELWEALSEHGFVGTAIPERYGGAGVGLLGLAIVEEELSAAGMPLLKLLISPAVAGEMITLHGNEEQRRRWLPGLAAGTERFALAVTEADAGSNTSRITTRWWRSARGYTISGAKTYISGLEDSEWILVLARGEDPRSGLSLFVVDVDDPQLVRYPIPTAPQAPEKQWTLSFDQLEVDRDRLIGDEGEAMKTVFDGLNPERIMSAALCVGVGRYALGKASAYANEREVWDQPIGAHQGVSHPLAEAYVQVEAARLMTYRPRRCTTSGRRPARPRTSPSCLLRTPAAWPSTEQSRPTAATNWRTSMDWQTSGSSCG